MKAKRISQKAVKNMINGNTALLHIGKFDTGKRTNLKRAVSECVYTSRLYYNKELQSDNEKIEYLVYSQPYRVFKVELYKTHIAAFNTDTPVTTDCKQETETNCEQVYDVVFNDDTASNCKHINSTYECCMQWIEANRHDNTTYFADYKGGTVSIVEVNTGNYVYTENI